MNRLHFTNKLAKACYFSAWSKHCGLGEWDFLTKNGARECAMNPVIHRLHEQVWWPAADSIFEKANRNA